MSSRRQLFFDQLNLKNLAFGGSLLKKSHAKVQRPIFTKSAMHMVLRAEMAKGSLSLLKKKNSDEIDSILKGQAKKHFVRIYKIAKAHNHIHLLVLPKNRNDFISFTRAITGLIPRAVLKRQRGLGRLKKDGAEKAHALKKINFWSQRPWTRIVSWGREYRSLIDYLEQNTLEAFGFIPYQTRRIRFSSA